MQDGTGQEKTFRREDDFVTLQHAATPSHKKTHTAKLALLVSRRQWVRLLRLSLSLQTSSVCCSQGGKTKALSVLLHVAQTSNRWSAAVCRVPALVSGTRNYNDWPPYHLLVLCVQAAEQQARCGAPRPCLRLRLRQFPSPSPSPGQRGWRWLRESGASDTDEDMTNWQPEEITIPGYSGLVLYHSTMYHSIAKFHVRFPVRPHPRPSPTRSPPGKPRWAVNAHCLQCPPPGRGLLVCTLFLSDRAPGALLFHGWRARPCRAAPWDVDDHGQLNLS